MCGLLLSSGRLLVNSQTSWPLGSELNAAGLESAICQPTQYATTPLHQTWNRLPRTSWLLRRCLSPSGPQPREYYVDLIRLENTIGIVSTLYDPTHRPYSGMLPSNTAPQPGNIEARKTISGIPEHPDKTVQARTQ